MVVNMMKWRPWPPLVSKKVEVKLVVKRVEGWWCDPVDEGAGKDDGGQKMAVEIRWKGPKIGLSTFRRTVKRNITREEGVGLNGVVEWGEEFYSLCNLSAYKDNVFHPWEISFTFVNVSFLIHFVYFMYILMKDCIFMCFWPNLLYGFCMFWLLSIFVK